MGYLCRLQGYNCLLQDECRYIFAPPSPILQIFMLHFFCDCCLEERTVCEACSGCLHFHQLIHFAWVVPVAVELVQGHVGVVLKCQELWICGFLGTGHGLQRKSTCFACFQKWANITKRNIMLTQKPAIPLACSHSQNLHLCFLGQPMNHVVPQ